MLTTTTRSSRVKRELYMSAVVVYLYKDRHFSVCECITVSVRVSILLGEGKSEIVPNVAAPPHMVPYVIGMGKDAHATSYEPKASCIG